MFLLTLLINLTFLWLILFPIIFIHEMGHALTARILGFKVFSVTMGYGRKILEFELFQIPIIFNLFPLQGLTLALAKTRRLFKTRMWLYVAGGPATHILSVFLCYQILGADGFLETISPRNLFLGFAPLTGFIYANAFLFLNAMIPRKLHLPTGPAFNDGYQLLTIPFRKTEWLEDLELVFIELEAIGFIRQEEYDDALKIYEKLRKLKPDNYLMNMNIGQIYLAKGEVEKSRNLFVETFEKLDKEKGDDKLYRHFFYVLYNNIAWTNVIYPQEDLLQQADNYSKKALNSSPRFTAFVGTRGSVLIRKGEIEAGLELLKRAFKHHSDEASRSAEALFIGIGEAKLGNRQKAMEWLEKARKIHSHHFFFPIAENEIKEIINSPKIEK